MSLLLLEFGFSSEDERRHDRDGMTRLPDRVLERMREDADRKARKTRRRCKRAKRSGRKS